MVRGASDLLTTLARCCKPIRGDDIVGFISRGKGLIIHRVDCANMKRLAYNPDRIMEVTWDEGAPTGSAAHDVAVTLRTEDQQGIVASITKVVADNKAGIRQIEGLVSGNGEGLVRMTLAIRDRAHLLQILAQLSKLRGVLEVHRGAR